MTEKRFRVNDLVKYNYSEIGEYIDENHTDNPLRNDEVVELLNELHSRNKRLEKKIQRERTSFRKTHERWGKEAEDKIKELSEENERLRRCINEIYTIARLEEV